MCWNAFDHSTATPNLLKTSHLFLNDTIRVTCARHASIMRCIWATGGGASRYVFNEICHRLSTRLNCLTGLSHGIVSIVVILPVTCIVRMSVPLSLVSLHSYHLTLGQRPSQMYCSSCRCLAILYTALDGLSLLMLTDRIAG